MGLNKTMREAEVRDALVTTLGMPLQEGDRMTVKSLTPAKFGEQTALVQMPRRVIATVLTSGRVNNE